MSNKYVFICCVFLLNAPIQLFALSPDQSAFGLPSADFWCIPFSRQNPLVTDEKTLYSELLGDRISMIVEADRKGTKNRRSIGDRLRLDHQFSDQSAISYFSFRQPPSSYSALKVIIDYVNQISVSGLKLTKNSPLNMQRADRSRLFTSREVCRLTEVQRKWS
ncbi:hypothetical protein CS022_03135 [Veronia nyctiphanis]|uniref:Uncharacterized protein n=1 Tax=Veronia nyctiphanis TaxID=1278244 RepID=A0A4V1LTB1_9GAMM|nr:hypothetical protein CS022_03135 [Veronia nyctiphanis]